MKIKKLFFVNFLVLFFLLVGHQLTFAQSCPSGVYIESLRGIAPFAQDNNLVKCGESDTLAVLIFSQAAKPLQNVRFTLDLPTGFEYGGFVSGYYLGNDISLLNATNPNIPVFYIPQLDSLEILVAYIGVKVNCDAKAGGTAQGGLVFDYEGATCAKPLTDIHEYSSQIKTPVLNLLSVTDPVDNNNEIILQDNTTAGCHLVKISQNGIDAYLNEFEFRAIGINTADYTISSVTANGITLPYSYNVGTQTLTATVGGSFFVGNFDAQGLPANNLFDEDEEMTIEICYTSNGCNDGTAVITYEAQYGCNNKFCDDATQREGAITYLPNFGATGVVTASMTQAGQFCANDIIYDFTLNSANTNPQDGLWTDLMIKWASCEGVNTHLSNLYLNGVLLPTTAWAVDGANVTVNLQTLTTDIDSAGGITDSDGDGQYDDLPGGEVIHITAEIDVVCASSTTGGCQSNRCEITRIEVNGLRHCGQDFQEFVPISPTLLFSYGEGTFDTNDDVLYQGGYITEVVNTTPNACVGCANTASKICADLVDYPTGVWTTTTNGYRLNYNYETIYIDPCSPVATIYLEAVVTAAGREKWIRYTPNSATYQGSPVAGVTSQYTVVGDDTTELVVRIPAGDPNTTAHDYFFNLDYFGHCTPDDYTDVAMRVVEECTACVTPNPCTIVRSCHSIRSFINWEGTNCCCPIEAWVDTLHRVNYGYTDCTMTTKVDPSTVPAEDKKRFLPGDTMRIRAAYKILDVSVFEQPSEFWEFIIYQRGGIGGQGRLEINAAKFKGWFIEDVNTPGVVTEIGVPSCLQSYDNYTRDNHAFPSMQIQNMGAQLRNGAYANRPYNCMDDPDINPNYPATQVIYDILPWQNVGFQQSMRAIIYWNRPQNSGCAVNGAPDSDDQWTNTCRQSFIEEYDLENGDIIYVDVEAPVMANPHYYYDQTAPASYILPLANIRQRNNDGACTNTLIATSCYSSANYEFHIPGPVVDSNVVTVTDCDVAVEHTFEVSNPLPTVSAGQLPWFENEYRPIIATEYLQPSFPNNLAYIGDATLTDPAGNVIPMPISAIDPNYGNLACMPDGGGNLCCIAEDSSQLASMRFTDNDYYVGLNIPYWRDKDFLIQHPSETNNVCDLQPLIHKNNDPFPILAVGGANNSCNYKLNYSLAPLCPANLQSSDFSLTGQFALRFIPNLFNDGYQDTKASSVNYMFLYPDAPYAVQMSSTLWYYFGTILPNPELSTGALNPMRQVTTFATTPGNFNDNNLTFPPLVATVSNPLIADLSNQNEVVTYEVCAASLGGGATHTNVVTIINVPLAVDLVSVTDMANAPISYTLLSSNDTANVYQITMSDLAPGTCQQLKITTELLFCPIGLNISTNTCIKTTSGCLNPQKASALLLLGATTCDQASACYQYIKEEAGLQVEWLQPTISNFDLCAEITFETRIKNVKPALLVNLDPNFFLPQGLEFVTGSWEVAYPGKNDGSAVWTTIPDPTQIATTAYGTQFSYATTSDWSTFINSNGLQGINSNSAITDSNKVSFRFRAKTLCDQFVSGTAPYFLATASDPCETTISTPYVASLPIILNNQSPANYPRLLSIADPGVINCGSTTRINISVLNISTAQVATNNARACFTIPPGDLTYTPGSVSYNAPAGFPTNAVETQTPEGTKVCFDTPNGIGQGQQFSFGFEVSLGDNVACGTQQIGIQIDTKIENQICEGQAQPCDLYVLNSVNPLIDITFAPPLSIAQLEVTSACDTDPATTTLNYTFNANNPTSTVYNNTITVQAVRDINDNGIVETFDIVLDDDIQNINVLVGQNVNVTGTLVVPQDQSCPILLNTIQNSQCQCENTAFAINSVQPEFIADLGSQQTICPNTDLVIDYCPGVALSLEPSAGGTIAIAGNQATIHINTGYGVTTPVILKATTTTGNCTNTFEVELYKLEDFVLGPFQPQTVCNNSCSTLNLNLPTNIVETSTITWTPNTYLSDSTSPMPEICNPAADITYTVTVVIGSGVNACQQQTTYPVVVSTPPTATGATLKHCGANGIADFILTDADGTVINGQSGVTVTYHLTQIQAENDASPLNSPYSTADRTIFARVENANGCFAISQIILNEHTAPICMPVTVARKVN